MNQLSRVLSGWGPCWHGMASLPAGQAVHVVSKGLLLSPKVSGEFTVAGSVNVSLGNGHTPSQDEFTSAASSIAQGHISEL